MAYQKCPICNGTKLDPNERTFNTVAAKCTTCNGTGIIDEFTGIPPGYGIHTSADYIEKSINVINLDENGRIK